MKITTLILSEFKSHLEIADKYYSFYETSAGRLTLFFTDLGIFKAVFDQVFISKDYIYKEVSSLRLNNFLLCGTDFQLKVWREAFKILKGTTISYKELAIRIGHAKSFRAVANALGENKIAYFIPCHRVIGSNGKLTGYKWGVGAKRKLLE
jgi:methylated-DNA-[protein]-cysteine S-methyltransferase